MGHCGSWGVVGFVVTGNSSFHQSFLLFPVMGCSPPLFGYVILSSVNSFWKHCLYTQRDVSITILNPIKYTMINRHHSPRNMRFAYIMKEIERLSNLEPNTSFNWNQMCHCSKISTIWKNDDCPRYMKKWNKCPGGLIISSFLRSKAHQVS